jgi:hypothetical protein
MNKTKLSFIVLLLITSLVATPAFAKGKGKPRPTPPRTQEDKVSAVSADSITISTVKHSITYAVRTGFGGTEVYVNGAKATINDVKVGMAASVSAGLTAGIAEVINAHDASTNIPKGK